jgi:hypothetical protein
MMIIQGLQAQDTGQLVAIRALESSWLTVDRGGQNYVPYIKGRSLNYPVIGLLLDTDDSKGLVLKCCVQQGTSVFVNNRIVDQTTLNACRYYDVDSLKSQYQRGSLFISFYQENLDPKLLSTTLMTTHPAPDIQARSKPTVQIIKRSSDQFADFFVMAILSVAAFFAFLINRYPKGHRDYFNFSKAFSLSLKEEKVLTQRNMSIVNTLFIWMYAMVISLLIVLFWKIFDAVPNLFDFVELTTLKTCFFSWLTMSFMTFCVLELKYLLIKILCSLLNVEKIAQIHFFDFLRLSLIFVGITFIGASSLYLSNLSRELPYTIILYIFIALLGVRIIILLFKLIGDTSFRKIHLISYLCTTEILPLLIGIRIFF